MTAFPPFTGVAEKVYTVQGPPLLGGVAMALAVVGEVAAAAASHGELRTAGYACGKTCEWDASAAHFPHHRLALELGSPAPVGC